ncbi:MAG: EFR1 family ferrodoxin [Spirochaetales bacterium]|nr:EFR1 family ferrodoxin [Spirochaetales bacterium]
MPHTRIYFFTGAGHSYAVARDLAALLDNTELADISSTLNKEEIRDETPQIGFVFPVYGAMPPKHIRQWLSRFSPGKDSVLFAVCTCGIGPGHSLLEAGKILKTKNFSLKWGFSVLQPQSGIGSLRINTPELTVSRIREQAQKVRYIAEHISSGGPDTLEKSGRFSEFLNRNTLKVLPTIGKLMGQLIVKGMKNMSFRAGTGCNGCGICEKLCPVDNITMNDTIPLWGDRCIGCMGCYHWCPEDAVSTVDLDMIQSPHPDVKVSELLPFKTR